VIFFSAFEWTLIKFLRKKWEKKSCDAIILLRKEIGDWRGRADTFWGSAINYGTQGKQNQEVDLLGTFWNHWNFCCEAEGEAEALKNHVTLFLEVALMKPKKLLGFENKRSPWISGRSQVGISPISSFFASHSLSRRRKFSFSFLTRDQQVLTKWFYFLSFYSSINYII
jgi:hypothetical protein